MLICSSLIRAFHFKIARNKIILNKHPIIPEKNLRKLSSQVYTSFSHSFKQALLFQFLFETPSDLQKQMIIGLWVWKMMPAVDVPGNYEKNVLLTSMIWTLFFIIRSPFERIGTLSDLYGSTFYVRDHIWRIISASQFHISQSLNFSVNIAKLGML